MRMTDCDVFAREFLKARLRTPKTEKENPASVPRIKKINPYSLFYPPNFLCTHHLHCSNSLKAFSSKRIEAFSKIAGN